MTSPDSKISILLSGGIDEQSSEELFGATVTQGAAPTLKTSNNTRLSRVRNTTTRAPAATLVASLGAAPYGMASTPRSRRTAVYATSNTGSRALAEDGSLTPGTGLIYDQSGAGRQNTYLPLQLSAAGAVPGASASSAIACAFNSTNDELWYFWTSTDREDPTYETLYAMVTNAAGTVLATPTVVSVGNTTLRKTGVTAHGASGVKLWWQEGTNVKYATASVSATLITVGVAATIVSGQGTDWDVTAQDATYAYFAGNDETTSDDGALIKINVLTDAKTSISLVGATTSGGVRYASLAYQQISGVNLIAVIFTSFDTVTTTFGLYNDSLVQQWAPQTHTSVGRVACKFLIAPTLGVTGVIYAISVFNEAFSSTSPAGAGSVGNRTELIYAQVVGGASVIPAVTLPWLMLQNAGGQLAVSSTETYPVFAFGPRYSATLSGELSGSEQDKTTDPSIVAYLVGVGDPTLVDSYRVVATPVARYGTVRGVLAPAKVFIDDIDYFPAGPMPIVGSYLLTTYRKDNLTVLSGCPQNYAGRFVKLKTTPEQPATVVDKDGVALIAAAQPAQWDGIETTEMGGPLFTPRLGIFKTTLGATWIPPAGVYSFAAIFQWTDAAGLLHRSSPSNIETETFDGATEMPQAVVSLPASMRNGEQQPSVDVLLYMTEANGTTYHLTASLFSRYNETTASCEDIPAIQGTEPQIYSLGTANEEILPQPAPPLRDVAIAGSRAWGVDAEVPSRLVYSKMRIAGVGFEWFPAGEVIVPSGAGDVLAIREFVGTVLVFAERGVFQIADVGPSNTGAGGSFGPPTKISDVGCANRASVLNTPVGVIFQDVRGRFALAGAGVQPLPNAYSATAVTNSYMLESGDEAVFCVGSTAQVFNWSLQKWTTWDLPGTVTLAVQSAIDRSKALVAQASGFIHRIDGDTYHATNNQTWETDWILLGGDFCDRVLLRNILFNARSGSAHGLTISIFTNYGSSATTSITYSHSEITSVLDASSRYTLKIEPREQPTRAIKLRIAEAAEAAGTRIGCQPLAVTFVFAIDDGLINEDAISPAAFKG